MENDYLYKEIIDRQNLIAYVCDIETYEIYFMTRATREMVGLKPDESFDGKKCYQVLQGLDAPCPFCTNDKLEHGQSKTDEHYNEKTHQWVSLEDTLITYADRPCHLVIARNITKEREAFDQVAERLTVEGTLVECIQTLSSGGDVTTTMTSLLQIIARYYAAERAYIFEYNEKKQLYCKTFEWCDPKAPQSFQHLKVLPPEYIPEWKKQFEEQGRFFVTLTQEQLSNDSVSHHILEMQGVQCLAAAPLKKGDSIIGFLGMDDPTKNRGEFALLRNVCSFVIDEMERRRLIEELEHISYTDMLTGLKNRNCYIKRLNALSLNPPATLGVIFVDINGMKKINDTFGHEYGDGVIRKAARLLHRAVPEDSYRVGGDEFVVLCEDVAHEAFTKLVEELRGCFAMDDTCDVSIGSSWKEGTISANEQVLRADDLMYAAKQKYYRSVLCQGREVRVGMATEVLQEIEEDRFEVYYQPQIDLETGKTIGAEALVRKRDEKGELLSPDLFVPYYEEAGVISHLDLHVLELVCADLQAWRKQGLQAKISVNFSRVTLMTPGIVEQVKKCCEQYGVAPESITIEMTESIGTMDHNQLVEMVQGFVTQGFSISLDNFGSQYSDLSILTTLDFDEIKFDKSLVKQLEMNSKNRIVMKYAMDICTALPQTRSLAEGIENARQLELLRKYRCERGQGYFFSKPMPTEDFCDLLREDKPRP